MTFVWRYYLKDEDGLWRIAKSTFDRNNPKAYPQFAGLRMPIILGMAEDGRLVRASGEYLSFDESGKMDWEKVKEESAPLIRHFLSPPVDEPEQVVDLDSVRSRRAAEAKARWTPSNEEIAEVAADLALIGRQAIPILKAARVRRPSTPSPDDLVNITITLSFHGQRSPNDPAPPEISTVEETSYTLPATDCEWYLTNVMKAVKARRLYAFLEAETMGDEQILDINAPEVLERERIAREAVTSGAWVNAQDLRRAERLTEQDSTEQAAAAQPTETTKADVAPVTETDDGLNYFYTTHDIKYVVVIRAKTLEEAQEKLDVAIDGDVETVTIDGEQIETRSNGLFDPIHQECFTRNGIAVSWTSSETSAVTNKPDSAIFGFAWDHAREAAKKSNNEK